MTCLGSITKIFEPIVGDEVGGEGSSETEGAFCWGGGRSG
jgi:hypothetical protein